MLHQFKLSTRILLFGIIIAVCFSSVFIWLYPKLKQITYDARYQEAKSVVESAWSILDYYAKQANTGSISLDQAKQNAREAIGNTRYRQNEYFWINDMTPRMIMHPISPELDGSDISNNKDPKGKRLFTEMVEVCKMKGEGYVNYYWPKPGEPRPVPKISYVKLYPEWEWIIGSGIYLDDVKKELARIFYINFGIIGIIVIFVLLLSYFMGKSLARPIEHIIEDLNEGTAQVASASGQVSTASQSLAEGASEQASSLEETSSSLEEMASMTRQNADNANHADSLMKEANQVVGISNNSMRDLTTSMEEISKSSEETSKIIKTIDEIAFQTNLLALNAAVEAARAGEAGAGFAVVADEVRNLAMRAADAAKNTAGLIEGTVRKIKEGAELVTKTNEAFTEVATGTSKVGELVGEIAAASSEQAQGIEQINKAVAEMDKVTQQVAANAEESASASEEMNAQAIQMTKVVKELAVLVGGREKNGRPGDHIRTGYAGKIVRRAGNGLRKALPAQLTKTTNRKKIKSDEVMSMDDSDFQDF